MPWADVASFNLTLLCTAVSAVLIACALLALEFFGSRRLARQAPGATAMVLAGGALAAWLAKLDSIALGAASLATLMLVAWPVSFEAVRHPMTRLFYPKAA